MNVDSKNKDRHSRFELRTLLEASHLLAKSQDTDFILNNLLLITMGKLMVSRGLILLFEPNKKRYRVAKSKGKAAMPQNETVYFAHFETAISEQVIACPHDEYPLPELISGDENCTLFNLQTNNNHIGFLCLGSRRGGERLNEQEISFVKGLSAISSVAIANSRIVKELKHTNRQLDRKIYELNTLLDLSKDFNKLVDREEIVRIFKFAMLGQMLIRNFFFVLEQDGRRTMAAVNNIRDELTNAEIDALFDITRNVLIVDDDLSEKIPFLHDNNIHALISLEFQNKKMAVVGVGKRANKKAYSEADFKFLQSLGNLALLSIQKTLLLEERIEKERLEEELNIAKSIQQGLLPHPIPTHPALDIAASNVSSQQVGGDYFDILKARNQKLLFAIGDVTGKGTPAALLMANLQAIIHVLLPIDISLEEATGRMNEMIYQNTPADKFVTFFWGLFDPAISTFTYVNAGHNPVLLFRKRNGECEKLEEGGLILGAMPTMNPYEKQEVKLEQGDLLVFYTDGVTEALNLSETEEYEEERLISCIQQNRDKPVQDVINAVIDDVNRWSNNIQYDDITLMAVKVR